MILSIAGGAQHPGRAAMFDKDHIIVNVVADAFTGQAVEGVKLRSGEISCSFGWRQRQRSRKKRRLVATRFAAEAKDTHADVGARLGRAPTKAQVQARLEQ